MSADDLRRRRDALAARGIYTFTQPLPTGRSTRMADDDEQRDTSMADTIRAASPEAIDRYRRALDTALSGAIGPAQEAAPGDPSFAPAMTPGLPPTTPEQDGTLAKIAALLGVDPTDEEAMRAAFERLFAPVEAARRLARRKLSAREKQLCRDKRICPAKYLATREATRARSRR